jgi:hypothetical protein
MSLPHFFPNRYAIDGCQVMAKVAQPMTQVPGVFADYNQCQPLQNTIRT